jgi:hypothetical protein
MTRHVRIGLWRKAARGDLLVDGKRLYVGPAAMTED